MSKRARNALIGATGVVALSIAVLIQPWEGRKNKAYRDIVGVWTICDGETKGVKPGMVKTDAECDAMLLRRVENDFYAPIAKCIPNYTSLPISLQASLLSAGYNVGVGAICKSTAARLARAGKYRAACEAVTRFNRAGGKVVRGLKLRREFGDKSRIGELELCLEGLR
ncbi:lysozyme [Allomesorhizobium camelthorni]|uniref:Lysozyme n=1 Tax=Allomesorhizobium camelthorni TaxID=475069 RepID=A0A6G4W785_9HYPH|nr:lysozyme [Mesorhizobium camelthorni]NGO50414.1 lysozyme [Mesorhizobium camelthorni]